MGTEWLFGGAFIAGIVAVWNYVKAITWRCALFFIEQIEIDDGGIIDQAIRLRLYREGRISRFRARSFAYNQVRLSDGTSPTLMIEELGRRPFMAWLGWRPLFYQPGAASLVKATTPGGVQTQESGSNPGSFKVKITVVRGSIKLDVWTAEAMATLAKTEETMTSPYVLQWAAGNDGAQSGTQHSEPSVAGLYCVFTPDLVHGLNGRTIGRNSQAKGAADLVLTKEGEELLEEVEVWARSFDWYRSKRIPWKRGWLLYGKPGTGKTSLAMAAAQTIRPGGAVHQLQLAGMTNATFKQRWQNIISYQAPRVILIEDIDNVFHGRKNVTEAEIFAHHDATSDGKMSGVLGMASPMLRPPPPMTFDTLLNALDGADRSEGNLFIVTTNDRSKIDSALSRPGRLDRSVELTHMTREGKQRLCSMILGEWPELAEQAAGYLAIETPAEVQERCARIALDHFFHGGRDAAHHNHPRPLHEAKVREALNPAV